MIRHWEADFYLGILEHARGNRERAIELMRKTAITTDDDFDLFKRQRYLAIIWQSEFFIARHETAASAAAETPCSSE
jgi:hypothetical protein